MICILNRRQPICEDITAQGLPPSEDLGVIILDTALRTQWLCDITTDENGTATIQYPDRLKAQDRLYNIGFEDQNEEPVQFEQGGEYFDLVALMFIKSEDC